MGITQQVSGIGIQVHSIDYILKCNIVGRSGNSILITPLEKQADMFQVNDPVVIMYIEEGNHKFVSGSVKLINLKENSAEIQIIEDDVENERRIFERYPVSMAISARRKFSSKRINMIARNISEYGMCAVSSTEVDMDEELDIDLITGKYMFYFIGKVIWRQQMGSSFEYGFQLIGFDVSTKSALAAYLGKLKEEYKNNYQKAR